MLLVPVFSDAGLRIILSSMLTMSGNFGRAFLSFCQQSSISWCSTIGQSMGAGSLKSCSMAFITCDSKKRGGGLVKYHLEATSFCCVPQLKWLVKLLLYQNGFKCLDMWKWNLILLRHETLKLGRISIRWFFKFTITTLCNYSVCL